jgi:hypothetical protein
MGSTVCVCGTANALDPGDYGYGYRYHGYNSLEQQQEAEHNQYNLQQLEQTQLDMRILNQLNGGQPPQFRVDTNVVDQSSGQLEE